MNSSAIETLASFSDSNPESVKFAKRLGLNVTIGMLLPLACLFFDPIVFKGMGGGEFSACRLQAWVMIGLSIICLAAVTFWRIANAWLLAFAGGGMFAGGLAAMVLGVYMVPLSIMGLIMIIGFLGFSPFLVGVIYLNEGVSAVLKSVKMAKSNGIFLAPVLGMVLVAGLPYGMQVKTDAAVREMMLKLSTCSQTEVPQVVNQFRFLGSFAVLDPMILKWGEANGTEKENLLTAYRQITGEDISQAYFMIAD
jgi:hypothetical protein